MILRIVALLVSLRPQLYFVHMVYLFMCTLDVYERAHEFLFWQWRFGHRAFRDGYSVVEFLCNSTLRAFQKEMEFVFPLLYRIRNSRFTLLLHFKYLGSTYQLKCFPRRSIMLGFLIYTAHDFAGVYVLFPENNLSNLAVGNLGVVK